MESFEPSPLVKSDDGSVKDDSALGQWGKFFVMGGEKAGRSFTVVDDGLQRKAMEAAGFVDIQEFVFKASSPVPWVTVTGPITREAYMLTVESGARHRMGRGPRIRT